MRVPRRRLILGRGNILAISLCFICDWAHNIFMQLKMHTLKIQWTELILCPISFTALAIVNTSNKSYAASWHLPAKFNQWNVDLKCKYLTSHPCERDWFKNKHATPLLSPCLECCYHFSVQSIICESTQFHFCLTFLQFLLQQRSPGTELRQSSPQVKPPPPRPCSGCRPCQPLETN